MTISLNPSFRRVDLPLTAVAQDSTVAGDFRFPGSVRVEIHEGRNGKAVTFTARHDADNRDETVVVGFGDPGGVDPGAYPTVTVTILDDDRPAIAFAPSVATLAEADGATSITVTATLTNGAHSSDLSLPVVLSGTAVGGGVDYTAGSLPTISILAGSLTGSAVMSIDPIDDTDYEADETITVSSDAVALDAFRVTDGDVTLTSDDLPTITLSLNPGHVRENGTTTAVTVTASRDITENAAAATVNVQIGTAASTATRGPSNDYQGHLTRTITLAANAATGTAVTSIVPLDDTLIEGNETVVIGGSATGFRVTPATFTIIDDEATGSVSVTGPVGPVTEDTGSISSDITFVVSLSAASAQTVTVTATTSSGTATGGTCGTTGIDYATKSELITFAVSETSKPFIVTTCPDTDSESTEDFTVTLSGATGATLGTATATGEIADNDGTPIYR